MRPFSEARRPKGRKNQPALDKTPAEVYLIILIIQIFLIYEETENDR